MTYAYYDGTNWVEGLTGAQVKQFALNGTITPETMIRFPNGVIGHANRVQGLDFGKPQKTKQQDENAQPKSQIVPVTPPTNITYSYHNGKQWVNGLTVSQIRQLALDGVITPDTMIRFPNGNAGYARRIQGLVFGQKPPKTKPQETKPQTERMPETGGVLVPVATPIPIAATAKKSQDSTHSAANDEKSCPYCGETIKAVAKKCKHCGEMLEDAETRILRSEKDRLNQELDRAKMREAIILTGGTRYNDSPKSRVTYVLLGLFFGSLGIHNFYAGRIGSGISQLLVTIILGWFIVPLFVVLISVLIEVIVVTHDGNGVPFR